MIRREFTVHMLNVAGKDKATELAELLSETLDKIEEICGAEGREIAIVRSKFEEASFYAKKAMAQRPANQEQPAPIRIGGLDSMGG